MHLLPLSKMLCNFPFVLWGQLPDGSGRASRLVLWNQPGTDFSGILARSKKMAGSCEEVDCFKHYFTYNLLIIFTNNIILAFARRSISLSHKSYDEGSQNRRQSSLASRLWVRFAFAMKYNFGIIILFYNYLTCTSENKYFQHYFIKLLV